MTAQEWLDRLIEASDNANVIGADGFAADGGQRDKVRSLQLGRPALTPLDLNDELRDKYNWRAGARVSDIGRGYLHNILLPPLLDVLDEQTRAELAAIPVGFVTLRALNAHAFRTPDGDPVIVVNQGLMTLLSEFLEVQVEAAMMAGQRGAAAADKFRRDWYRFLLTQFDRIKPFDNGLLTAPYELIQAKASVKLEDAALYYVVTNLAASELFVLAHEFAHVYAGHLAESTVKGIVHDEVDLLGKTPLDCYQLSWEQETVADRLAYVHFLKAWPRCELRKLPGELRAEEVIAPLSFFELLHFVESNLALPDAYMTHPPAIQRCYAVMDVIALLYNFEKPEKDIDVEVRDMCLSFARHLRALQEFKV
jgi:hypothetical protein